MRPLTREQARAPKRETQPITIPEYNAPLLLAKPSASLAVRLREGKGDLFSEANVTAMLSDMLVDEEGEPLFSPDDVPTHLLPRISMDSLNTIVTTCFEMYANKGGAPVPPKPSPSV